MSFSGRPYGFIDEALASLGRQRRVVLTVNQFFTAGRVVARATGAGVNEAVSTVNGLRSESLNIVAPEPRLTRH